MTASFSKRLLDWYDQNHRLLPWRSNPTPYHVWLSEIMLQQTRVEAVKGYYARFLAVLPSIESLANASEDTCLKLWEGLGYYSRVRNLRKAAMEVVDKYQGKLPEDEALLGKLPGIGKYTAAAIASIAFQKKAVAVDGNLLRVFSRLTCSTLDIREEKAKETCHQFLFERLEERPGDFNQALMDLGEIICLPHGVPKCDLCPFRDCCKAHMAKKELDYPTLSKAKEKKTENLTVLLFSAEEKIAIRKRPEKGLLASLYEFPNLEGTYSQKEVEAYLEKNGISFTKVISLGNATHIFTHRIWKMNGYRVLLEKKIDDPSLLFVSKEELNHHYSLPSAFQYFL